jgi:hypothetical protein
VWWSRGVGNRASSCRSGPSSAAAPAARNAKLFTLTTLLATPGSPRRIVVPGCSVATLPRMAWTLSPSSYSLRFWESCWTVSPSRCAPLEVTCGAAYPNIGIVPRSVAKRAPQPQVRSMQTSNASRVLEHSVQLYLDLLADPSAGHGTLYEDFRARSARYSDRKRSFGRGQRSC